jgi:hypothetical protein
MIAPRFTETGIMPIPVRRLFLGLSQLRYFLGLKNDHYACPALNSSIELCQGCIETAIPLPRFNSDMSNF